MTIKQVELDYIVKTLVEQDYNKTNTAQILGISTRTLYKRLKEASESGMLHKKYTSSVAAKIHKYANIVYHTKKKRIQKLHEMTLGERIRTFDNLQNKTVKSFNKVFADAPLENLSGKVEIGRIVNTNDGVRRVLLVDGKRVEHVFNDMKGNARPVEELSKDRAKYEAFDKDGNFIQEFTRQKQAAEYFGVANSTIAVWMHRGQSPTGIKIIKTGGMSGSN